MWKPDPGASHIDAFSKCWNGKFVYLFPTFCLISRCLQKLEIDQTNAALLIAPIKAACGTASNTLIASGSPNIATFKGTTSAIEKTKTDGMFFLQQQFPTKGISEPAVK